MRIAIVNDTLIATEALRRIIKTVPDYEIAWTARDGAEAVNLCAQDTPDLILMDLFMPVMDGVEATRQIMESSPCAVLVVTATVEGHAPKVFDAMGCGALDVVSTPVLDADSYTQGGKDLLAKVATIRKLVGKPSNGQSSQLSLLEWCPVSKDCPPLIAIGASTGGPQALATILSGLGRDINAAIAIVQHVDVQFVSGLVEWLKTQTALPVKLAIAGRQLEVGTVVIAASNDHLTLRSNCRLAYIREPRDYAYRPSVDVFFKSIAQHWQGKGIGVLLTGMGRDGAEGLAHLQSASWHTIAQDRSSCVVYGMPKAAVELGAAKEILPIEKIAPAIIRSLQYQTHK